MKKETVKKLVINLLTELQDIYHDNSCNDIHSGQLEGVSGEEFLELEKEWVKNFPPNHPDDGRELIFDTNLVDIVIHEVKKL